MDEDQKQEQTAAAIAAQEVAAVRAAQGDFVKRIVEKIKSSENILIALSKTPSIDELSAAIGLTLFLDGMQRHVTTIYSGGVPDALKFLQPETVFEQNTASLQDFIIALDKDKADHLRYKLEGDLVRIYITPYKTVITEKDLTFERGDYNVDFIIAINVKSVTDLDDALADYGKILHDASTVNITARDPGRFGEIEWSNQAASSVCEMMTELVFEVQGSDTSLDNDVATALLTGIVAATERFSNNRTNSETLSLASKLMALGADQQLITANVLNNDADVQPGAEKPKAVQIDPVSEARMKAQEEAKSAIEQEVSGDATKRKPVNPAALEAQKMKLQNAPAPADVEVPGDTPAEGAVDANGIPVNDQTARDIAAAMPLNTNSAVVMPTMGTTPPPKPVDPNAPTMSTAEGSLVPSLPPVQDDIVPEREMAESEPEEPTKPIQGVTLAPPPPKPEKDYGAMMDEALASPGTMSLPPVQEVEQAEQSAPAGVEELPPAPEGMKTTAPAPVTPPDDNSVMKLPGVPSGSSADAPGVASDVPSAAPGVLPPPPPPGMPDGMMPPVLPPVQS